jgi:hypothetical protein
MEEIAKLMPGDSVFLPSGGVRLFLAGTEPPKPGIAITNTGEHPVTVGTMYLERPYQEPVVNPS